MEDPTDSAAEQLMRQVQSCPPAEALELANRSWPQIRDRVCTPPDAETCRLASISAAVVHQTIASELWRARALSRFIQLDWHEGAAAVLMTSVYKVLAIANGDQGTLTLDVLLAPAEARLVLEELRPFTQGNGAGYGFGPTPKLIERFLDEKTGFLLMVEGRWDEAHRFFDRAERHAVGDPRGTLKVALGQCQLRYVSALCRDEPDHRAATAAADATQDLLNHPEMARQHDLRTVALVNTERMKNQRRDLVPYEIL